MAKPAADEQAAAGVRARTLRWALGVAAVVLAVCGVVAWNALYGDGTLTVLTAEDPSSPETATPQTSGEADPAVGGAAPTGTPDSGGIAGTGSDEKSDGSEEDEPVRPQASTPDAQEPETQEPEPTLETQESEAPSPEALSTGPVLQWTEIDPGIESLYILQSVGDGRVLARSWPFPGVQASGGAGVDGGELASGGVQVNLTAQILVSRNGTDWTEVPMAEGVSPDQVDISGDRWLVAGPDTGSESFHYGPSALPPSRAFFSDDEGTTWTELDISVSAGPRPSSPWLVEQSAVTSALVSGEHIVLVVQSYTTLDAHGLLADRGLLPDGKRAAYWLATPGNRLEITLFDAPDPDDPSATPMLGGDETLEVGIEELGLTYEEAEAARNGFGNGTVSVLSSDGSTVELAAQYDGLGAVGASTGRGFELTVFAERDLLVLSSTDGLAWSEERSSWDQFGRTVVAGGTIWRTLSDPVGGFGVQRGDDGQNPTTVATFEGLAPVGDLTAGPAGVTVSAFLLDNDATGSGIVVPDGRVAKDGYELRYNEPEGGVSLWDLAADAPVYEFGPEMVGSDTVPDGVREIHDNGTFAVVFEDPETGADLVTFTEDDLNPIFESRLPVGDRTYVPPELWVGWSADGTYWGWQTQADAFGIDEDEAASWAQFAVGRDFVIAQVQVFPRPEPSEATDGQSGMLMASDGEAHPPRWFIAQVP